MNNDRNLEPEMRLKAAQLNVGMGDWVHSFAPRQLIAHLMFEWAASFDSGRRCYEKFMRTETRGVSYFYALEQNPGRDGCHAHALWRDCKNRRCTEIWDKLFHRHGRARIESVNSRDDVADYCVKYAAKENAWWNVKLLKQCHPANKVFKLGSNAR